MGVCGLAGYAVGQPLVFPSLGPTAYLFFETPLGERASVRNSLIGHGVALLVGAFSVLLFGLWGDPSVLQEGVTLARVGVAAFSVALTGAALLLVRASHPPAGATVLIVSLGLLDSVTQIVSLAAGVVLVTAAGWLVNRACGVPVPLWAARSRADESPT